MTMTVVAWNCAGGFERKAPRIADLPADIAVVCEIEQDHMNALGAGWDVIWTGAPGEKGLLLAARAPWTISKVADAPCRHVTLATAALGARKIAVVGVWAMRDDRRDYAQSVCDGLDHVLKDFDSETPLLVAGDFNASPVFDTRSTQFSAITSRLEARGLSSLWHATRHEAFGAETCATYFHRRKREEPFHIDYMCVSQSLLAALDTFEIGGADDWIETSDHMPLIGRFR